MDTATPQSPSSRRLQIQSPSSTTVLYTVSSLSCPRSKVVTVIRSAIRLVVAFYALLALLAKARAQNTLPLDLSWYVELLIRSSLIGEYVTTIVEEFDWWVLVFTSTVTLYLCLKRDYTEESLLVLQGLGIQTSTSSPYFFMGPTTTFIPSTQIQDIVIHEAFKGFEVRFYLAIIVEGATEVVVVFPNVLPRRAILEEVWRGSRKCL